MSDEMGVPFNPGEFQHILKQMNEAEGRQFSDQYSLWCMAQQIEANRVAIEELRAEYEAHEHGECSDYCSSTKRTFIR